MIPDILRVVKRNLNILIKLLPIFSFIPPLFILYSLYAWSFEQTLHGRTFLLFFVWLIALEIILSWEKLRENKLNKLRSMRTVLFVIAILIPTTYVIAANYCGLNSMIEDLATQLGVEEVGWPVVSVEYMVFAVFCGLIILLAYGISGLENFSISTFFAGTIGILFTMDNLYPWFPPLQIFVPATAKLAVNVLNLMGYTATSFTQGSITYLIVKGSQGVPVGFGIAWPCSGIESLVIYTVVMLLFLKKSDIRWIYKMIYFVFGAVVTYFINALRVVTLVLLGMQYGVYSPEFQRFHNYYGMLYSVTWIISYPLIIIGSRALWERIRNWKTGIKDSTNFSTRTKLSE